MRKRCGAFRRGGTGFILYRCMRSKVCNGGDAKAHKTHNVHSHTRTHYTRFVSLFLFFCCCCCTGCLSHISQLCASIVCVRVPPVLPVTDRAGASTSSVSVYYDFDLPLSPMPSTCNLSNIKFLDGLLYNNALFRSMLCHTVRHNAHKYRL